MSSTAGSSDSRRGLSVVIPTYNSVAWLPSTLAALQTALAESGSPAEVIIVDDGSTDGTSGILASLTECFPQPIRVLRQSNKGRFLARWAGVESATKPMVLLLDSRVLLDRNALKYVHSVAAGSSRIDRAWNAHIVVDHSAPLVGHFWDVPVYVFWGSYLRRPKPTLITSDNFDRVPKGTTAFLVERSLFQEACKASWPVGNSRLSSDDTKILRYIAQETPIRLDPGFAATYRPRTTLRGFLSHARDRGTLFVDSYAGTSRLRDTVIVSLVALPLACFALAVGLALAGRWLALLVLGGVAITGIALPAAIAVVNRVSARALSAYFVLVLPFGAAFWMGLARGLVVHRGSFRNRRSVREEGKQ